MSESSNYFNEIEAAFNRGRRKFKLLSPLDWGLMAEWQKREIPLFIVLRAMSDVREKSTQQINSLAYFESAVNREFVEFEKNQVGKHHAPEPVETNQSPAYTLFNNVLFELSSVVYEISCENDRKILLETTEGLFAFMQYAQSEEGYLNELKATFLYLYHELSPETYEKITGIGD